MEQPEFLSTEVFYGTKKISEMVARHIPSANATYRNGFIAGASIALREQEQALRNAYTQGRESAAKECDKLVALTEADLNRLRGGEVSKRFRGFISAAKYKANACALCAATIRSGGG